MRTPIANLVRYKPSGTYFARVRIRGKLFLHAMKTDVMSVTRLRLGDFIKEKQEEMGDDSEAHSGKMTVGNALVVFRQRLDGQQNIKDGAKVYRRKCIEALVKSWPGLEAKPVGKVSKDDCLAWASRFASNYSPSVYNNVVGTLLMILARIFHKRSVLSWCRTFFPEIQLRRDLLPPLLGYEIAFAPLVK